MIIVITASYAKFHHYMKYQFPYFSFGPDLGKHFSNIRPDNFDQFRSLERGTTYIQVDNIELPDWFTKRFTRILVVDTPRHHTFASDLPRSEE